MYFQLHYVILLSLLLVSSLHAFDANEDIYFELYTYESPDNYQVIRNTLNVRSTTFNPLRPTRIFVHGFRSDRSVIKQYAKAFLKAEDVNFIAMNWIDGAETILYPVAKNRVDEVSATRFFCDLQSLLFIDVLLFPFVIGQHSVIRAYNGFRSIWHETSKFSYCWP